MTIKWPCSKCGERVADISKHKCVANSMANTDAQGAQGMANIEGGVANSTYRYRDPDKRREYMREYMRGRRARNGT